MKPPLSAPEVVIQLGLVVWAAGYLWRRPVRWEGELGQALEEARRFLILGLFFAFVGSHMARVHVLPNPLVGFLLVGIGAVRLSRAALEDRPLLPRPYLVVLGLAALAELGGAYVAGVEPWSRWVATPLLVVGGIGLTLALVRVYDAAGWERSALAARCLLFAVPVSGILSLLLPTPVAGLPAKLPESFRRAAKLAPVLLGAGPALLLFVLVWRMRERLGWEIAMESVRRELEGLPHHEQDEARARRAALQRERFTTPPDSQRACDLVLWSMGVLLCTFVLAVFVNNWAFRRYRPGGFQYVAVMHESRSRPPRVSLAVWGPEKQLLLCGRFVAREGALVWEPALDLSTLGEPELPQAPVGTSMRRQLGGRIEESYALEGWDESLGSNARPQRVRFSSWSGTTWRVQSCAKLILVRAKGVPQVGVILVSAGGGRDRIATARVLPTLDAVRSGLLASHEYDPKELE